MSFIIYSKEYWKTKIKVRKDVQEYPNMPLAEAGIDKLYDTNEAIGGF